MHFCFHRSLLCIIWEHVATHQIFRVILSFKLAECCVRKTKKMQRTNSNCCTCLKITVKTILMKCTFLYQLKTCIAHYDEWYHNVLWVWCIFFQLIITISTVTVPPAMLLFFWSGWGGGGIYQIICIINKKKLWITPFGEMFSHRFLSHNHLISTFMIWYYPGIVQEHRIFWSSHLWSLWS